MNDMLKRLKQVTQPMQVTQPEVNLALGYGPQRVGKSTLPHEAFSTDIERTDRALRRLNTRFRRIDQQGG